MNGSLPWVAGRPICVGLALLALIVGCADDSTEGGFGEPTGVGATPSTTSTSADGSAENSDVSEIKAQFEDYWDAVVKAQSGEAETLEELFEGIAVDALIEDQVGIAHRYDVQGVSRVGAPVISNVDVEVSGNSGTVSACVDESNWRATLGDGQTLPPQPEQEKPHPIVHKVIKSGGSWLIDVPVEPEGTITC